MAIEGLEGWEDQKKKGLLSREEFHLDTKKLVDPVDALIEKHGPSGAFDELADQLPRDTDPEIVRQMKLILTKEMRRGQH